MGTLADKPTPFALTREEEFLLAASEAPTPQGIGVEEGFDWRALTGFSEREKNTFLNQYLQDETCSAVSFSAGYAVLSAKAKQRVASISLRLEAIRKQAQPIPPATKDVNAGMPRGKVEPAAQSRQPLTDTRMSDPEAAPPTIPRMTPEQEELWRLQGEAEEQTRCDGLLIVCYDVSLETDSSHFDLSKAATKAGFPDKDKAARYFAALRKKGLIRLVTRSSAAVTEAGKTAVRAIRSGCKQQSTPPTPSDPLLPTPTANQSPDGTPPSKGRLRWLWGVTNHQVVGGLIVALVVSLVGVAHIRGCFETKLSWWIPTQQSSEALVPVRPAEPTAPSAPPNSRVQGTETSPTTTSASSQVVP